MALSCCVGMTTLLIYLGIYAFKNPDMDNVWVIEEPLTLQYGKQGMKNAIPIHNNFVLWFHFGFICTLLVPITFFLINICSMINPKLGGWLGGLTMCGATCGGFAWWITGMIWRFDRVG